MFSRKTPFRIGRYKKKRGIFYNHKMKEKDSLNKVDKFLNQLLPPLEEAGFDVKRDYDFKFFAKPEEKEKYRKKMIEAGVDFSKPIIAFSIYSRVMSKIYPIEKMKILVQHLIDKYSAQIIFFYSADQKDEIQKIHKELGDNKNIFSSIETPTIKDLVPFFENCAEGLNTANDGISTPWAKCLAPPSFPSDKNMGVSPINMLEKKGISREEYDKLPFEEKFSLIDVETLIEMSDKLIEKNKRK